MTAFPSRTVGSPRRKVATMRPGRVVPAYGVLRLRLAVSDASTVRRATAVSRVIGSDSFWATAMARAATAAAISRPRNDVARVLRSAGASHRLGYRYESWVQLRSRRPLPRVELQPLADELNSLESGGAVWRADPIDRTTPELRARESTLDRPAAATRAMLSPCCASGGLST